MTGNGICDIICERAWDSNFKRTIGETHAHTGKYLWGYDNTTVDIKSDDNDTIVDTDDDKSEVDRNKNHNCVKNLEPGLDNAPGPSFTNKWE